MKKLMMFAAAMTIVGGAYAGVCTPGSSPCDTPVWDFVMKGKTANGIAKGYKAVYSISYKGAIVGNLQEGQLSGTPAVFGWVGTTVANGLVVSNNAPFTEYVLGDVTEGDLADLPPPYDAYPGDWVVKGTNIVLGLIESDRTTNSLPPLLTEGYQQGVMEYKGYGTQIVLTNASDSTLGAVLQNDYVLWTEQAFITTWNNTVITPAVPGELTGECCLKTFTVYLYDKANKDLWVFEEQEVDKMSVFGKGLEKAMKPGGRATLESDVMWKMVGDEDIELQFVGFGKAKYGLSKGGTSGTVCNPVTEQPCVPSYDWPSWSGWFTGTFGPETDDSHDLNCPSEFECVAVAGGTWSAKLNKKLSNSSDPEAAIYRKFKVSYFFSAE